MAKHFLLPLLEVLLPQNPTTLVLRKAWLEKDHNFDTSDTFWPLKAKKHCGVRQIIWVTGARPRWKMRWERQPLSHVFPVPLGCSFPNPTDLTNGCEHWNYEHSSVLEVEPSALIKPLLFTLQQLLKPLVSQGQFSKGNPVISKQNIQPRFTPSSEKHCIRWSQPPKNIFLIEFRFIFLHMAIKKLMAKDIGSSKNDAYQKILLNLMQHEIIQQATLNTLL